MATRDTAKSDKNAPKMSGLKAIAAWKQKADESGEARGEYIPFMSLSDGEVISGMWFLNRSDPLIIDIHSMRDGNKFRTIVCNTEGDCVPCRARHEGDKRVSKTQQKAVFLVADPRFVHQVVDKERSSGGFEKFKFIPCKNQDEDEEEDVEESDCRLCASGRPRERAGVKRWEMSMTYAVQVAGLDEILGSRCVCGGKIKSGSCRKCGKGTPLSIFDVPIRATRNGVDKQTSYSFAECPYEPVPAWVKYLVKNGMPDVKPLYRARSAEAQAELMGIKNPFSRFSKSTSSEASSYDSDDDMYE